MRALGELWMQDTQQVKGDFHTGSGALAAMDAATACGYVLASELRALRCGLQLHPRARFGSR